MDNKERLVRELVKLPNETEWLEFKHDNYNPEMIGEDICALANGAALMEKQTAYMLWGIRDSDHEIVGTTFDLQSLKAGNEELGSWLRHTLSPHTEFSMDSVEIDGVSVNVISITCARNLPIAFRKEEYIRVGSYTKKLKDVPALQIKLWDRLRSVQFEEQVALENLELMEALRVLDYSIYFDKTGTPQPSDMGSIGHYLIAEGILIKQDNGLYAISNLGAILYAKKLDLFPQLARKAPRVIQYDGTSRLEANRRYEEFRGFAICFEDFLNYIEALLPAKETIEGGLRVELPGYPPIALREILGNALIHQDYTVRGAGPLVEIFSDRVEISNPGTLLVEPQRIVDNPPRSRNEKLAALCRRMHICEEGGTGWDKSIIACELSHQPAPKIDQYESSVKVTLYGSKRFTDMTMDDRLWACYMHSVIRFVQGTALTNSSLRERLGLANSNAAQTSRLIKLALSKGLIKPQDATSAPRYMKYIPYWA